MIKINWFMIQYLIKARKIYIVLEIGKSVLNSLAELAGIYLFKVLIDSLVAHSSLLNIIPIIAVYASLKKGHEMLFQYVMEIELPKAHYALEKVITEDIISKALTIDLECYDNTEFYNKYTKALEQTGGRSIAALNVVSNFIFNAVSTIGLFSLIVTMDLITIVLAVFFFLSSLLFVNKNKELMYEREMSVTPYNRHTNYCKQVFFSRETAKDLRIYGGIADYLKCQYIKSLNSAEKVFINSTKKKYKNDIIRALILMLSEYVLPLVYFSGLFLAGYITIGSVTALWESMKGLANNASGFIYAFSELKQSDLYIENLKYILEYVPKVKNSSDLTNIPQKIKKISFVNVSFAYPGTNTYVLKNVSMTIYANQKIAFVGHNGAGKSTLIKLLLRLYDPTSGHITVNDIDIKSFDINEYRHLYTTMFQDFSLFSVPISVNITMKGNISEEDEDAVIKALEKVGLNNRIICNANGIHSQYTKIFDDNGILLSGGEMQKLALARVFANSNSSSIGVFDEPSSALDVESENLFYENLMENFDKKTLFLISHRLSTTIGVDKIYMLEEGSVIESGSHQELMDKNGKYAHIFRLQADKYKYENLQEQMAQHKY